MAQQKTKVSLWSKVKKSKRTPIFASIIFLSAIVLIGGIFVGTKYSERADRKKELETIVIGDTAITQNDIDEYANLVSNYRLSTPGAQYELSPEETALNELVLNAALRKEAKDRGISLSNEDILKTSDQNLQLAPNEQRRQFLDEYNNQVKSRKIPQENEAYKQKLYGNLIIEKNILLAHINIDTPYFKRLSQEKVGEAYRKSIDRLNNEFLPLMKNGTLDKEIGKKADVNLLDTNSQDDQDHLQYYRQAILAVDRISKYNPGATVFNDIEDTSYIRADIGAPVSTDSKLAALKNVGDVTDVFVSKSGLIMAARLEKITDGSYGSWNDFLDSYIKNNVKYKTAYLDNIASSIREGLNSASNKAILSLTSVGLETAQAQSYDCSNHTVQYDVYMFRKDKGKTTGNTVNLGANGPKIRFLPQPDGCVSNPDANANGGYLIAGNGNGNTGYADCMKPQPTWGGKPTNDPNDYDYVEIRVAPRGGGPYGGSSYAWIRSGGDDPGVGPKWTPSTANAYTDGRIDIFLVYEKDDPIPGTLNFDLSSRAASDCSSIQGYAFYRRNDGTDIDAQYRITPAGDTPGGWFVGYTAGGDYDGNFRKFRVVFPGGNPGNQRPSGVAIWGELGGTKYFRIEAKIPPGVQGAGTEYSKIVGISANGCGTDEAVQVSVSITCKKVTLNNIFDRNAEVRGMNVPYEITVYYRNADGSRGPVAEVAGTGVPAYFNSATLRGPHTIIESGSGPFAPKLGYNYGFIVDARAYNIDQQGVPNGQFATSSSSVGQCYSATCSIEILNAIPGSSGLGVEGGTSFQVRASINQTGELAVPGGQLKFTYGYYLDGGHSWTGSGEGVQFFNPGETINLIAPDGVGEYAPNFYPDYAGYFGIGPRCLTVHTYERFDLTPQADTIVLNPDNNAPESVTFNSSVVKNITVGVNVPGVTATRQIAKNSATFTGSTFSSGFTATDSAQNFSDTANNLPQPRLRGDIYCGRITVSPAAGWVGPADRVITTVNTRAAGSVECEPGTPPDCPPATPCTEVVDHPYVKAYGGDVAAGGGFGDVCTAVYPGIFAYMRPLGEQNTRSGSGSQLASYAWGSGDESGITGFASANLRDNSHPPRASESKKLTFANFNVPGSSLDSLRPFIGGKLLSGDPGCLPDYFSKMAFGEGSDNIQALPLTNVTMNNLQAGKQTKFRGSLLTITGGSLPAGKRHTTLVEGDAVITGNITYGNFTISNVSNIPNFTLVVKGDIYISDAVSRLDGRYIAQPRDDGTGGRIYTCASGTSPLNNYDRCNRQLTVYGNFTAQQVVLGRTFGDIEQSRAREGLSGLGLGTQDTRAGEVFVFTAAELYLGQPVSRSEISPTSGNYQSISTLPPIL